MQQILFDPEDGLTMFVGPGGFTQLLPMRPDVAASLARGRKLDVGELQQAAEGIATALDIPFVMCRPGTTIPL